MIMKREGIDTGGKGKKDQNETVAGFQFNIQSFQNILTWAQSNNKLIGGYLRFCTRSPEMYTSDVVDSVSMWRSVPMLKREGKSMNGQICRQRGKSKTPAHRKSNMR